LKIDFHQNQDSVIYYYSTNGEIPTEKSFPISQPYTKSDSIELKVVAFLNHQKIESHDYGKLYIHKAISQKINLTNQPSSKYFASGANSLLDGKKGGEKYTDGKWIGFESKDCEAVIELNKEMEIKSLQIGFLEANKSWIFLPTSVQILVSIDGINYTEFGKLKYETPTKESNRGRIDAIVKGKSQKIKFIKVIAKNQNTCPAWHSGAGKSAWLFMDEIMVK
jgi:hexosaminidase